MSKKYILYDGRDVSHGTETASILCMADSLKEIIVDSRDYSDGLIYAYDDDGKGLTNEKLIQVIGNPKRLMVNKVFCKDCMYFQRDNGANKCKSNPETVLHPLYGEIKEFNIAYLKNKDCDCEEFEKLKEEPKEISLFQKMKNFFRKAPNND